MIPLANIFLAAGDDGSGIVPFVVMVVFMVVLTIIKRIRQGAEKTGPQRPPPPQAEDEEEAPPSRPLPQRAPRPQQGQAPQLPDWMRPAQPPPQAARSPRPAPRPEPQPERPSSSIPSAQRQRAAPSQARPAARAAKAPLAPAEEAGDLAEQVDREVLAQQQRYRNLEDDRGRRLSAIHLAKAPQLGGVSHLRSKSAALTTTPAASLEQSAVPVSLLEMDLRDPDQLRAAMILHEIFLPPKATRGALELWER